MTSFLRWVDFSADDRERMRRAIALFEDKETRDELGLGTIRDVFADSMFPGTSTIQTRLRYFLFLPWIYQELERRGVPADKVGARARKEEVALIERLLDSDDTRGVLGKRARGALKRLPSSVYWAGLLRWDVVRYKGSREQYHRAFDQLRAIRRGRDVPEDEGVEAESLHTWHPRVPAPPPDWPDEASFELTPDEAAFLTGRLAEACGTSLLAWSAMHGGATETPFVWLHPDREKMPDELRREVDLARRFSAVMHGASILYNVLLAELAQQDDKRDAYDELMHEWATSSESPTLRTFDLDELWAYVDLKNGRVPMPSRRFVERWVTLVAEHGPEGISELGDARTLVERRERALKGPRSRFASKRGLEQWSGGSGIGRLAFRWPGAQQLLNDLHAVSEGPA